MAAVTVAEVEAARDAWIAAVKEGGENGIEGTVDCYDPVEGKLLGTKDKDLDRE